jgi:hypothetical protein
LKAYGFLGKREDHKADPGRAFLCLQALGPQEPLREKLSPRSAPKKAHGSLLRIPKINQPCDSKDDIDPAVMRRTAEGDSVAFGRAYDAFSGILYSLAPRILEQPDGYREISSGR